MVDCDSIQCSPKRRRKFEARYAALLLLQVYESLKEYTLQGSAVGLAANAQYALGAIHPNLLTRSSFLIVPPAVALYLTHGCFSVLCATWYYSLPGAEQSLHKTDCGSVLFELNNSLSIKRQLLVCCGTTVYFGTRRMGFAQTSIATPDPSLGRRPSWHAHTLQV